VSPSRYKVILQPSVGYPVPYVHASFRVSSGEKVSINFRPTPLAISDSIENGKWVERYEGSLPNATTYYVWRNDGGIKDLHIQYYELETHEGRLEYKYSVIVSVDKLTIYADKSILNKKSWALLAEGDVTIEEGEQIRKAKAVRLDLTKEPVGVNVMKSR
jgi:hypothetical protein